ncbi:hypothetical protein [Clostridium felsineum]|uniref:Uncharacterized protein n=1 Tax=Clostridium felsineum TaxID=36839 RepID=A0A1S8LWR2_9CLOT|nr:hypothetical protein [Clostridium felsineum]URZ05927.1 hypothetical protein CLROS_012590 [Clostridium felsineum]URZ10964.1 hypothetical protein CROST_016800 [Clostridium felsineum]
MRIRKINIRGFREEAREFFTGKKIRNISFDYRNKKIIAVGFIGVCVLFVVVSIIVYVHSKSVSRENLKHINAVSIASPDVVNKQYIKDSINKLSPYEEKLMNRVVEKNKKTNSFNKDDLEINDYLDDLQDYKKKSSDELNKLQGVTSSTETATYKNNIIKEYQVFVDGLNHEINYINEKLKGNNSPEIDVAKEDYKQLINIYKENDKELVKIQGMYK